MNNKSKVFALLITSIMIVGIASPFANALTLPGGTEITISPTFRIVLLTPVPNPNRQAWAQLVTDNLAALGIQSERVIADWDTIYARALTPDTPMVGKIYDQGGFDTLFVGYAMSPDPNPYALFHSSQYPPDGQNYYLYNSSVADELAYNVTKEMDFNQRMTYLKEWQAVAYEDLPEVTILYTKEVVAMRNNVNGTPFTIYHYPLWCPAEQWRFLDASTQMVLAQTGPAPSQSLSPLHTTSYYDLTAYGAIFGEGGGYGMMMRNTSWFTKPHMATAITHSADFLKWNATIRTGMKFHDGTPVDGRDIVATLRAAITPDWISPIYAYTKSILGTDATGYGNFSVWYSGEAGTNGSTWPLDYYKVGFSLPKVWVYFDPEILGTVFYPANLLLNSSSYNWNGNAFLTPDPSTLAGFKGTSFSTGTTDPYTYYGKNATQVSNVGPFGSGPYKFVGIDTTLKIVKLQKFDIYWNRAALEATGAYQIVDFWVRYISGRTAGIAALHDGEVQVLDSQYSLTAYLDQIDPAWGKYVSYVAWGLQEFGFNMKHPVFGTGVDTPLGKADPTKAAEAARHVRHAIEWLIPKDYIIKNLMNNYAVIGMTTSVLPQMAGGAAWNSAITIRNATVADAQVFAMRELMDAGYAFIQVVPPSFWDTYGLLLSVVELAVVVVLAGFIIYRLRTPAE